MPASGSSSYCIAAIIALVLVTPHPAQAERKETTLRVTSPRGTFETSPYNVYVTNVAAEVRNVGEVPAEGITVTATLPGGQTIRLNGPDRLERNKSVTYSKTCYEIVTNQKKISAKATCSNCRY